MEFTGRVAVVTGGASGIGAGCLRRLREEGATAVSWDVAGDTDILCDTTDEAAQQAALAETIERFGVPSVLVAAAGVNGTPQPLQLATVEDWDRVFAVNVRGVFLSVKTIAAAMIEAGLDGSMVAIGSVNGVLADPSIAAYSASKAAVLHLARLAAVDLGSHGIRVNAIGPGPTETGMTQFLMKSDTWANDVAAATPLGRLGTPDLVADAVINVLRSDWITGQAVMADGGSSLMTARGQSRAAIFTQL